MASDYVSQFRFQARGRVAVKDSGNGKPRARVMVEGGLFSFFGDRCKLIFDLLPPVGEECIISGSVIPTGEANRIGQGLYTLEVETVGPIANRAARAA